MIFTYRNWGANGFKRLIARPIATLSIQARETDKKKKDT